MPHELDNYDAEPTARHIAGKLDDWLEQMQRVLDAMQALDMAALSSEQQETIRHAVVELTAIKTESESLDTTVRELAAYASRLEHQRVVARDAFEMGYKSQRSDLLAQVTGKTYAVVLEAMNQIDHNLIIPF